MSRVVEFDRFGGPEVLHIVADPVVDPGIEEVRVRIEAFAVNPLDVMMRSGATPAPVRLPRARLGIEGTGVIDALGAGVTGLRTGDPVILTAVPDARTRGSYAEHLTIPASRVIARPAGLDVTEAAAIWVAYSTAYGALVEKGGLRPADRLLISGASGAVGRAAIRIANQIGAVPIALTRTAAKTDELLAAGAATVIAADAGDVAAAVLRDSDGLGADVTLDLVRGPGQRDLLRATRPGGTLLAAGFLDTRPTPEPGDTPVRIVGYRGFDDLLQPEIVRRTAAFLNDGVRRGVFRAEVDTVYRFEEIVDAHRRFDRGVHAGRKIVVVT